MSLLGSLLDSESTGDFIPTSEKGAPNGVAPLGGDSKVPAIYLPPSEIPTADEVVYNPQTGLTGINVADALDEVGSFVLGQRKLKYVASNGTNDPDHGSLVAPYQTIQYAYSQIENNGSIYGIIIDPVLYTIDDPLTIKPSVSLMGNQSSILINGNLNLDSEFLSLNTNITISDLFFHVAGSFDADFSEKTGSIKTVINFEDVEVYDNGGNSFILNATKSTTGKELINFNNCFNTNTQSITTAINSNGVDIEITDSYIETITATNGSKLTIRNTQVDNWVLDGVDVEVNVDRLTSAPTLLNGAKLFGLPKFQEKINISQVEDGIYYINPQLPAAGILLKINYFAKSVTIAGLFTIFIDGIAITELSDLVISDTVQTLELTQPFNFDSDSQLTVEFSGTTEIIDASIFLSYYQVNP